MDKTFKPDGYNSVSPYFIVNGAQKLMDLLQNLFNAKALRKYNRPDGSVMHAEMQIDDSVIMLSDATEKYPPIQLVMHVYVPDVDEVYTKALAQGCTAEQAPTQAAGDPDRRGTFIDFAGNMWSVSTQMA